MRVKMAVFAPMPMPRESRATVVRTGFLRSVRERVAQIVKERYHDGGMAIGGPL